MAGEQTRGGYRLGDVAVYESARHRRASRPGEEPPPREVERPAPRDVNEEQLYAICGALASR